MTGLGILTVTDKNWKRHTAIRTERPPLWFAAGSMWRILHSGKYDTRTVAIYRTIYSRQTAGGKETVKTRDENGPSSLSSFADRTAVDVGPGARRFALHDDCHQRLLGLHVVVVLVSAGRRLAGEDAFHGVERGTECRRPLVPSAVRDLWRRVHDRLGHHRVLRRARHFAFEVRSAPVSPEQKPLGGTGTFFLSFFPLRVPQATVNRSVYVTRRL